MKARESLRDARLLLVTDPRPDLTSRVRAAVRGGVDVVQLRDKHAPREELVPLAAELREICESEGAIFTVNDDVKLARITGAAGIHLVGQEDTGTRDVRALLGPDTIVGRSAGTLVEAMEALREGADYLGIGAVYATPTKPEGDVGGTEAGAGDLTRQLSHTLVRNRRRDYADGARGGCGWRVRFRRRSRHPRR